MTTLQTQIYINNAIAIFRNHHQGKEIGDITVRINRSGYIVTARVDGKFERQQLPEGIVSVYTSDSDDSDESVSSEGSHRTGDTTDSFARHILDNDFHAYIVAGGDYPANDSASDNSVSTFE